MRVLVFLAILVTMQTAAAVVHAQDVVPTKTWGNTDAASKRVIKPLNLKAITRKRPRAPSQGPITRNTFEILREGDDLPQTPSLSQSADFTPLKGSMRLHNTFYGLSDTEARRILERKRLEGQEKVEKMQARRAAYYMKRGQSDQRTRAWFKTASGSLELKKIRAKKYAEQRTQKATLKVEKKATKAREKEARKSQREQKKRAPVTIVPTSRKDNEGTIKPFFYR